jgi:hypothetical protein
MEKNQELLLFRLKEVQQFDYLQKQLNIIWKKKLVRGNRRHDFHVHAKNATGIQEAANFPIGLKEAPTWAFICLSYQSIIWLTNYMPSLIEQN